MERIDKFTNEVTEAFSTKFDPEPEVKEVNIVTQDNHWIETSNKIRIALDPVSNPQITTIPSQPTQPDFTTMKVKELRQHIKQFNLQSQIKSACGKSFSKCTKLELIKALS